MAIKKQNHEKALVFWFCVLYILVIQIKMINERTLYYTFTFTFVKQYTVPVRIIRSSISRIGKVGKVTFITFITFITTYSRLVYYSAPFFFTSSFFHIFFHIFFHNL